MKGASTELQRMARRRNYTIMQVKGMLAQLKPMRAYGFEETIDAVTKELEALLWQVKDSWGSDK